MNFKEFSKRIRKMHFEVLGVFLLPEVIEEEWEVYCQERHDSLGIDTGYPWEFSTENYLKATEELLLKQINTP